MEAAHTIFSIRTFLTTVKAAKKFSYLTNHYGEGKDANKVIDELEADLKDGGGIWQAADGD